MMQSLNWRMDFFHLSLRISEKALSFANDIYISNIDVLDQWIIYYRLLERCRK